MTETNEKIYLVMRNITVREHGEDVSEEEVVEVFAAKNDDEAMKYMKYWYWTPPGRMHPDYWLVDEYGCVSYGPDAPESDQP